MWVRNYANGPKWIKGIIKRAVGPVSFDVEVNGNLVKRHVDQLRLRTNSLRPEFDNTHISETDITLPTPMSSSNEISNNEPSVQSRVIMKTNHDPIIRDHLMQEVAKVGGNHR